MPSSDKTDIDNGDSQKPVVTMIVQEVTGKVSAIMWSDSKIGYSWLYKVHTTNFARIWSSTW